MTVKVRTDVIKRERIKRGWNQSDVARRLDRGVATISRLERGTQWSPGVLKEVADLLQVQVEDLLTED